MDGLHRIQADRQGWVPNNLQDDAWATDALIEGEVMLTFRGTQGLVSMPEFSTMQILVVMHGLVVVCGNARVSDVIMDYAVICGNAKVAPKCTILSLLAVIQVLGISLKVMLQ